MRRGVLHPEHHAAKERRHRGIEAIGLESFDAAGLGRAAGIIEQAVDAAELVDGFTDQVADVGFDRDIGTTEKTCRA